jgi:hypothetical protein
MAAYPATPERKDMSTSLLMIHPSQGSFHQLKQLRTNKPMTDLNLFRQTFSAPGSLISEWSLSMGNVVYESKNLRNAGEGFNATAFEQATTFVRLSDPELPGPEYDVPYLDRVKLRPENEQAQEAWSTSGSGSSVWKCAGSTLNITGQWWCRVRATTYEDGGGCADDEKIPRDDCT